MNIEDSHGGFRGSGKDRLRLLIKLFCKTKKFVIKIGLEKMNEAHFWLDHIIHVLWPVLGQSPSSRRMMLDM
jgi:hypothetical protein